MKNLILLFFSALAWGCCETPKHEISLRPSEYVTTLVGTQSDYSLSTGNTYPAVALPWGMNFWTPQTGKMGDGWAYTYGSHTIRGLKQTHQPSPWINDYGQFSIMPVRGKDKVDENARQSWFSHQSETAKPYYYSVYLADHDVVAEMAPTDRAAVLRFTFPESDESGVVIDAFDRGSQVKVMPDSRTVVGYTTRNSGGVPDNFRNWFVIRFDKPFSGFRVFNGKNELKGFEAEGEHALAAVYFTTRRGEQVTARVASSFISEEQALRNLETEVGDADFETVKARAQERWDEVLGRIEVSGGTEEQYRTFYSCLYRSTLFPRKFYEIDAKGNPVHYSPYNGEVLPGYMYTDTGFWDTFRCLFPLLNLVYPSVNAGGPMPPVIRKEGLAPVCGKRHDFCGGGANVNAHRKHLIVQFRLFHLSILAARLCRGRFALALRSGIPRLRAAVRLLSNRTLFRPRTVMENPALSVQIMSGFIAIFP